MLRANLFKVSLLSGLFMASANLCLGLQAYPVSAPMPAPRPPVPHVPPPFLMPQPPDTLPTVTQDVLIQPPAMRVLLMQFPATMAMPTFDVPVQPPTAPMVCPMQVCPAPQGIVGMRKPPMMAAATFEQPCPAPCGAMAVSAQPQMMPAPCPVATCSAPCGMLQRTAPMPMAAPPIQMVKHEMVLQAPRPINAGPLPVAQQDDMRRLYAAADQMHRFVAQGDRAVMVQAMCVQVPMGFCKQAGLVEEKGNATGPWALTPRESRMFHALLTAEPRKTVLTRPTMIMTDNEPGCVQVGQEVPVVTGLEATSQDGNTVYVARMRTVATGVRLMITPHMSVDGKEVLMRVKGNISEMDGNPTQMPVVRASGEENTLDSGIRTIAFMPVFNVCQFQTAVELSEGWTAVIRTGNGKETCETLWVLTTHMVDGK